jgi:hypothetical protein
MTTTAAAAWREEAARRCDGGTNTLPTVSFSFDEAAIKKWELQVKGKKSE